MSLVMLLFYLSWCLVIMACGTAARLGGRDGRRAAVVAFVVPAFDLAIFFADRKLAERWVFPAAIDTIELACFGTIMLRSRRWWPVWMTGFQFDAVLAHLAGGIVPDHAANIFRGLHTFWGAPMLLLMMAGVISDYRAGIRD